MNCYGIAQLLDRYRSPVLRTQEGEYNARYHIFIPGEQSQKPPPTPQP